MHGFQARVPICQFLAENVVRNGRTQAFLVQKNAPFSCKNANLPNRTCFTRLRVWGGGSADFIFMGAGIFLRNKAASNNFDANGDLSYPIIRVF